MQVRDYFAEYSYFDCQTFTELSCHVPIVSFILRVIKEIQKEWTRLLIIWSSPSPCSSNYCHDQWSLITREILNARRLNPPSPVPVDALQLCIEAAGKLVLKHIWIDIEMATFSYRSCLFDIFQGRENYRGWDCCSWVHLHIGRVRDKIMLNVFGLFGNTDRSCKYGRKARERGKPLPKWSKWSGTKLQQQLSTSRRTCWLAILMCRWLSFSVWGGLISELSFSHLYFFILR